MMLTRVVYDLYESDLAFLEERWQQTSHELGREVRLEGLEGTTFVSWQERNGQFSVVHGTTQFFHGEPEARRDVSDSRLWRDAIGKRVSLEPLDSTGGCVALRWATGGVYFSAAADGHESDMLTVAIDPPAWAANNSLERSRES
jgi:hypothetical protein